MGPYSVRTPGKLLILNDAKLRWRSPGGLKGVGTVCLPFNPLILNGTKLCWVVKGYLQCKDPSLRP
jgi:hypothetical protein